jgi:DNA primase
VRFVELSEGLGFRDAAEVLAGSPAGLSHFAHRTQPHRAPQVSPTPSPSLERQPDELAALRAATSLYHRRLLTDSEALEYVEQRGLDSAAIDTCQIGYAAGDELVPFLRWRRMELGPALRVGLLNRCGQEFLAGRIVVPELRDGQPVWLAGRLLGDTDVPIAEAGEEPPPKYLVVRGSKPLLGASALRGSEAVIVVEGVFDVLTLRRWGYPAVALLGTHARPDILEQLRGFRRIYLVLDQDDGGVKATLRLMDLLGAAAIPVALPEGTKDVAQLAPRPDGQMVFASALLEAVGALEPDPTLSPNCA